MRSDVHLFFGRFRQRVAASLAVIFAFLSCGNAAATGLGCDKSERALISETIESRTNIKDLRVIVANNMHWFGGRVWNLHKNSFNIINGMQAAVRSQNTQKLRTELKLYFINEQTGGAIGRDIVLKGATAIAPDPEAAIGAALGRSITKDRFDTLLACKLVSGNIQLPYITDCNAKIRQFVENTGGGDRRSSVCDVFWEIIADPGRTTP